MSLIVRPGSGLSFPWEEHIDRGPGYTQSYVFTHDGGSQASMLIDCPWSDFSSNMAVTEILGQSTVDFGTSPPKLRRTVPMVHPKFRHFYAMKIANVAGIKSKGRIAGTNLNTYERARLTIIFQQVPYVFLTDFQLTTFFSGKEYLRWTHRRSEPVTDALVRERGSWKWAQGPAINEDVAFGVPQWLSKNRIDFTWHMVPSPGLFGLSLQNRPAKQEDGLSRVNNATWLGYPAGTLLLTAIGYRERLVPYSVVEGSVLASFAPGGLSTCYDVTFSMLYFDPPAVDSSVARGHNLVPQPKGTTWALISTDGTTSASKRIYDSYNYDDLFILQ